MTQPGNQIKSDVLLRRIVLTNITYILIAVDLLLNILSMPETAEKSPILT